MSESENPFRDMWATSTGEELLFLLLVVALIIKSSYRAILDSLADTDSFEEGGPE